MLRFLFGVAYVMLALFTAIQVALCLHLLGVI